MIVGLRYFEVFIRTVCVQKRRAETHLHDVLSEPFKKINSPSNTCVFTERNQSAIVFICNFFIIYQSDFLLKNFVKSGHIVRLGLGFKKFYFDGVREIQKSLIGDEFVDWNLFNTNNQIALGQVLTDNCSLFLELIIRENPLLGGLHNNLKVFIFLEDFSDMFRRERRSSLPDAFILSSDAYFVNPFHVTI